MPTATFLNLPEPKRARFVEAALDEFASRPYDQASVSAIVQRLGIAKGSVYQYFEDKVDLFAWLIAEGQRRRIAAYTEVVAEGGLFDKWTAAYRAGLAAWAEERKWARVGLRLFEPTVEPRVAALRLAQEALVHRYLRDELAAAQAAGELRTDVDVDVAAHLVQGLLQDGLLRAFLGRLGTDLDGFVVADIPEERLRAAMGVADEAVGWLRRALAR